MIQPPPRTTHGRYRSEALDVDHGRARALHRAAQQAFAAPYRRQHRLRRTARAPIHVSIDGGDWQQGELLVVPSHVPHRIACDARVIADPIVEPETVDPEMLPPCLRGQRGQVDEPDFVARVRQVLLQLQGCTETLPVDDAAFDEMLFGRALPRATLDPRIAQVVADIAKDPAATTSAADYTQRARLSFYRFVHLFKDEVGAPLRTFAPGNAHAACCTT